MTKTPLLAALIAAAAAALPAHAATDTQREAARERMQNMTPEEKAAAREKMKEKWQSMTPEQQEAAKKRFRERHPEAAKRMDEKKGAASAPN